MNVKHIITEIEKVDPEVYERLDTRRSAMKQFTGIAGKLTLAALPLAFASMFKKAYGQGSSSLTDILNYALTLEHLEAAFYKKGIESFGALNPPAAAQTALTLIGKHETAHVNLLKGAIGASAVAPLNYDFTGSKNGANAPVFPDVFTNYATFLAVAQALEDTGVRAYKGQANMDSLVANNEVLTIALQIHSVEARHAAHIRYMRRKFAGAGIPAGQNLKPWITLNQSGIGSPAADGTYAGEETTTQATIPIVGISSGIAAAQASEAFDEPLTKDQVLAIAGAFIY